MTCTDHAGTAFGRARPHAVSPTAVHMTEREDFASSARYRIRDTAAVDGQAVRRQELETRPEQAAFRERVGRA